LNTDGKCKCGAFAYALTILGGFLIVAALVWAMRIYTQPEPLGTDRAAERRDKLRALRAENHDVLTGYAWFKKDRGIVRLPIDRALVLAESLGTKDSAALRAEVIARQDKLNKPVSFE